MNLKYVFTRLIYKIKYKSNNNLPIKKITNDKHPKVYLMGAIEHMNYGDQAINLAENKWFNDQNVNYVSIPESMINEALPLIKRNLKLDDVFYCHGGGNMGDVWPKQEKWRHDVFANFPNNKIIVFPQSVNYKENSELLKEAIEVTSKNKDLTFLMRDEFSYKFVIENFLNNVNVKLVPDIVMTLKKANLNVKRQNKVTTFLRRDVEKLSDSRIEYLIANLNNEYDVINSDTVSDYWYYVDDTNREKFLDKKLYDFQTSKFIVTDRLHGMIFAAITKTPAIVFDNNNHKIFNLYNTWLKDCKYLKFVDQGMTNVSIESALKDLLLNNNFDFDQEAFKEKITNALTTNE